MEAREVLTKFKQNEITLEEAEHYFRKQPFEEMDYAKLDSHREIRSGFPEVIFCSGKADVHFTQIFKKLYEENGEVFGTRGIEEAYRTGRGKIRVRAITNIEPMANGKNRIIVTELPYMVNKARR